MLIANPVELIRASRQFPWLFKPSYSKNATVLVAMITIMALSKSSLRTADNWAIVCGMPKHAFIRMVNLFPDLFTSARVIESDELHYALRLRLGLNWKDFEYDKERDKFTFDAKEPLEPGFLQALIDYVSARVQAETSHNAQISSACIAAVISAFGIGASIWIATHDDKQPPKVEVTVVAPSAASVPASSASDITR